MVDKVLDPLKHSCQQKSVFLSPMTVINISIRSSELEDNKNDMKCFGQ